MFLSKIFEKILPPEGKIFYNMFEESAEICHKAAILYQNTIFDKLTETKIIEAKQLKNQSSVLKSNVLTQLNNSFITPFDREDIQTLAYLLNRITKRIAKGCLYLKVYHIELRTQHLKDQAETLVKATEELKVAVQCLRNASSSMKKLTDSKNKMLEIENHGDEILLTALEDLFSGKFDAPTVIKMRDIYRWIEKSTDNCYNVTNTILGIVLKHG